MADYRYHLCDALTGLRLEELPLDCQSFSQQISGTGTLTGTLALGDIDPTIHWRGATTENRTLVIVQRGDQYVWGGIITKRRPVAGGTAAEITAKTLEHWLANQELWTDLPYTTTDVFDIVRGILAQVQGVAGGDMRITSGTDLAGYTQTVTYLGKDSPTALDSIDRLADVAPGFEYTISWSRSGNVFSPVMTLATPGLSVDLDPILLQYPGNLIDYGYDEDGSHEPNTMTGVGGDSGGTPLLARVADTDGQIAAGYPRWYGQIQAKEETDLTRLTARTQAAMDAGLADYVVPTAVLRGDADPHFGDIPLGISAQLRATSLYHPAGVGGRAGLNVTRRVSGWTVVPKQQERVTLELASTTGKILRPATQRTQAEKLRDLERRVRELATRT